jgi:hypothetical protein
MDGLTDEQLETPATIGDGDWSAKDLIGHVASWEELALDWLRTGAAPDPAQPPTDEFNAQNVASKRDLSLDRLREESAQTHAALLAAIEQLDDERWGAEVDVPGRGRAELGRVIGYVLAGDEHGLFAHDLAHVADLEAYVRSL